MAQRGAFRRYLLGLLSDSRRKSMSAMLARVSDPGHAIEAFQHFITDAPWSGRARVAAAARRDPRSRGRADSRRDELSQAGDAARSASRASTAARSGKVANCQVAVTAALWTGVRAWMLGARVVSARSVADARGAAARAAFRRRCASRRNGAWRSRCCGRSAPAGFTVTAVFGDAEFGDNATLASHAASREAAVCAWACRRR